MADTKRYKVVDGPVSIRKTANGELSKGRLGQGEEFESSVEPVVAGDYIWVQHDQGWSAIRNKDGDEVFMLDISDRDPKAPRLFKIWASSLSIRSTPNGTRTPKKVSRGSQIEMVPGSRTEAGNYVWWKHSEGWSAECSINGKEIFMKEIFDAPVVNLAPSQKAKLPEHLKGKVMLQVTQTTKVRTKPSTDPKGMIIIYLKRGKTVLADMDTVTEADGYYWVKHDLGWSAIMSLDGTDVFLAEPGTIPGLIYIGPEGPKPEELPGYKSLITRHPIDLSDLQWFQYFGNNMWAYLHGKSYGYDRYSQGLHGGLDYGNSARAGIKIYAGIEGEYVKTEYPRANNARIFIKNGDYTFIYQHITNAQAFKKGQKVKADTYLANIEHHSINNGWDHVHFEVRYLNDWIINPILLMTDEIAAKLLKACPENKVNKDYGKTESDLNFFFRSKKWTKWTTGVDQPMIKLGGTPVGPRFEEMTDTYDTDPQE